MRIEVRITAWVFILLGLYLTSLYSFLLFHTLGELFSISVAFGIFMLAWNSRRFIDNNYLLFIGIAYLFIGGVDLIHTLAYKGMNIFEGYGSNLPTQLWIAARYLESISLLIAPLFFTKNLKVQNVFIIYSLITTLLLGATLHWDFFPDCFIEGTGLTPFKKISEYIISLIFIASVGFLSQHRKHFDVGVFRLIVASIVITIGSELAFTFYISVYGFSNLLGHFLKIISFYLIYKAIIETGLVKPYSLLFRNLKLREAELEVSLKEKDVLLREVHHRVKNNLQIITSFLRLQAGKIEDVQYAKMFQESQNRIKSMALIHEMLYKTKNLSELDFKTYVHNLTQSLMRSHAVDARNILLKLKIVDAHLDLDCAITCGIILNELISNALTHAFPEKRQGQIDISFKLNDEKEIELKVSDNGIGIPPGYDFKASKSLGLRLITILAEDQLRGSIDLNRENGTHFTIRFKCRP